jgi:PhzF family phenazine biosynthesis protein
MSFDIFQVDAFAERPFSGNPAGVCVLARQAPDKWMQAVAGEMNVAETAFLVRRDDGAYDLRWFTPTVEVDLCGHATLATAHVLFEHLGCRAPSVSFQTQSGALAAVISVNMRHYTIPLTYSISTGNEAVCGIEDFVEHMIGDSVTRVIALVVEQFRQPKRFLQLAHRARAAGQFIVLLHPGRSTTARAPRRWRAAAGLARRQACHRGRSHADGRSAHRRVVPAL